MSDTKVFSFPDGNTGGRSDLLAILPALLNQRGIDPAVLPFLNNDRKGGSWGEDIIGLIVLLAVLNGGVGGFGGFGGGRGIGAGFGGFPTQLSNDANTATIMQAVTRNGFDINTLSTALNTSSDAIIGAINALSGQICNVANQMGQNTNQVLTALLQGNNAITSQICSCCCDLKQLVSESNYLTERAFCNTNQILTRGFSDLGYAFRDQTCDLKQTANANTASIIAKLDAIEDSRKDRELAEKDRMIATLTARSERQAELQPIYNALNEIQCNQPPVKKVACAERYIPVNEGVNATYGLIPNYCGYGFPFGGNFFNGFNNAF